MKYFSEVILRRKPFSRYKRFDRWGYRKSLRLAYEITPLNVIHINSTAEGGGVAELLNNQIPLEKDLSIKSRWLVLRQPAQFFAITKKIHNLLQGNKESLTGQEKKFYLKSLLLAREELSNFLKKLPKPVILVLHDAQTLPLAEFLPADVFAVSRMHIDLSRPNAGTLNFLKPYFEKVRAVILSHPSFRPLWLSKNKTVISYPAIDPFSEKNITINRSEIIKRLTDFGWDTKPPIITQVSRFDKWKDPRGVAEAYRLAKKITPGLQLVLEGSLAVADDPEAMGLYLRLKNTYGRDPDIFLNGPAGPKAKKYGERWINILQRGSNIVIQKSLKEGFGLTVAEALWKNKAVIGGGTFGIKAQIKNGKSGFVVNSPEECASRIVQLLNQPKLADRLGQQGHDLVKKYFLFSHLILDFLEVYKNLLLKG